jgi:hypothetical protein
MRLSFQKYSSKYQFMKKTVPQLLIVLIFAFGYYILLNNVLLNLVALIFDEERAFFIEGNWCNIIPGPMRFSILLPVLCYLVLRFIILEILYRVKGNGTVADFIEMFCFGIYFFDLLSVPAYFISSSLFDYFFSNSLPQFLSAKLGLPVYVGNLVFGLTCLLRFKDFKLNKRVLQLIPVMVLSFALWTFCIHTWF